MEINRELAMKLWNDVFGNVIFATDCFGSWICKYDYGIYNNKRIRPNGPGEPYLYGWDIDHIRPKSDYSNETDANFMNNFEPMHHDNNLEKSDNFPNFKIGTKSYQIVKCTLCSNDNKRGYGIVETNTMSRVDWKGKQERHYIE